MNNLFVATIYPKRQTATLVFRNERLSNPEFNQVVEWLRAELSIRGVERIKLELKGFLKELPIDSYVKFHVKLDHDPSVLNIGGGGCMGYVSDYIVDAYDTLVFTQVEVLQSPAIVCLETLKSRFQLAALTHVTSKATTQIPSSSSNRFNNYITHGDDEDGDGGGWDHLFTDADEENAANGDGGYVDQYSIRDCIIFLIDCSPAMFETNTSTNEQPFANAIKCLIQTITDKIISSDGDLIGLCFFGTDKSKNINDFENIYVASDLDIPDPKIILQLEDILDGDLALFGGSAKKEFSFCDALWTCSTMFSNCNIKVSHKRIFLFTNEDNPNAYNENLRNVSFQRAKDLADLGIEIELFSMDKADDDRFEFSRFYENIVFFKDDAFIGHFDATAKFDALRAKLKRKEFKKRSLGRLPLHIGGQQLAMQLYNLVASAHKSSPTLLDPTTNLPVKVLTKNICMDTGASLLPSQLNFCHYYGGEPVVFARDEIDTIRAIGRLGLVLMGFKPLASIKRHRNIKHPSFLVPDERSIRGSTVTANALITRMLASDRVAICRFLPRSNTSPRFVALVAQEEVLDAAGGIQLLPRGFHIMHLPFADDIRSFAFEESSPAPTAAINKAKKMIKALHIDYNDRHYLNPGLQSHYSNLQALALERETVEPTIDVIKPNQALFDAHIDLIKEYESAVFSADYLEKLKESTKKRDREGKNLGGMDWEAMAKSGEITKLTVQDLNTFLKNQNLKTPTKAKKADIVEIATNFILEGKINQQKLDLLKKEGGDDVTTALYDKDKDDEENNRPKKKQKSDLGNKPTTPKPKRAPAKKKAAAKKKKAAQESDEEDEDVDMMARDDTESEDDSDTQSSKKRKAAPRSKSDVPTTSTISTNTAPSTKTFSKTTTTTTTTSNDDDDDDDSKPICKYDGNCYRKNPDHLNEFRHVKQ
eukprot:gene7225-8394_t